MISDRLRRLLPAFRAIVIVGCLAATSSESSAQLSGRDKDRARTILEQIRKDLHEFYYDSTFGGRDIDAAARRADSAIQVAPNMPYALGIVAQYLADLKDSHTRFWPPGLRDEIEYGFEMMIVGDSVYVSKVKKGSDAEAKGLKRGDLVLAFDQMRTTRASLDIIEYVYDYLSPRPTVMVTVASPGEAQPRKVAVNAKVTRGQRVVDYTDIDVRRRLITEWEDESRKPTQFYRTVGDSVLIWRMPEFVHGDEVAIDLMIDRAKRYRALIFDLRNNGGGSVATELYLIGKFFDRDVPVLTMRERDSTSLRIAKPTRREPYRGMLVVLINSNSASASEIFARVMQLEGRGIVVGDRSMGAVITSRGRGHVVGFERILEYGLSVSIADVIMPDGKRLENVGVMPDHVVLPTRADLAAGSDPQMAKALELVGVKMSPDEAAKLGRTDAKKTSQ